MRPTLGADTEICRYANELILKIEITLWGLKRTKDKLRTNLKKDAGAIFKWRGVFFIKRHGFIF
jgi:hypothetical protein